MSIEVQQYLCETRGNNFTETAPRPPVPGEENESNDGHLSTKSGSSHKSQASSRSHTSHNSNLSHSPAATPRRSNLADFNKSCSTQGVLDSEDADAPLGFEPEGSANLTPPFTEGSTPPFIRWAENIHKLLDDHDGVELYQKYLQQENCVHMLLFWFACEGLKKQPSAENEKIHQLIKGICRRFIKANSGESVNITAQTRNTILDMVAMGEGDQTIFDDAQSEVEAFMSETVYSNFLKSDLYLQYIQLAQNGAESPKSGEQSSASSTGHPTLGPLPTVHEDSELENDAYHCPPFPAQVLMSVRCRKIRPSFSEMRRPEAYAGIYLQESSRVPHPYHVPYSSYAPVSAQDSELQSLSSDAPTDDSSVYDELTTNGKVRIHCTKVFFRDGVPINKKIYRQNQRAILQSAQQNREISPHYKLIPRTQRDNVPSQPLSPKSFAKKLTDRLLQVQRDREAEEKMEESLKKIGDRSSEDLFTDAGSGSQKNSSLQASMLLNAVMKDKLSVTDDSDQSILDEHVSRIWNDSGHHTPSHSPGSRSPERRKSGQKNGLTCLASGNGHCKHPHCKHPHRKVRGSIVPSVDNGSVPGAPYYEEKHSRHHGSTGKGKIDIPGGASGEPNENAPRAHAELIGPGVAERRGREGSKHSSSKKGLDSSSVIDSGISMVYESNHSLPNLGNPSNERVFHWMLESERYAGVQTQDSERDSSAKHKRSSHMSSSSASPSLHRPRSKKPVVYNTSRSGSLERGGLHPWGGGQPQPAQPFAQDPNMPILPPPNIDTQLEEAKRRLEDETKAKVHKSRGFTAFLKDRHGTPVLTHYPEPIKQKIDSKTPEHMDHNSSKRSSSKKQSSLPSSLQPSNSSTTSAMVASEDLTVVGYYYGDDQVPYRTKIPSKNVTLKQFKAVISKKGNYKYFFRKASDEFGTRVVKEEISDDNEVLPLFEGKIIAYLDSVD